MQKNICRGICTIGLITSLILPMASFAEMKQSWPKAPWKPELRLNQAADPQVCEEVYRDSLSRFFQGYPDLDTSFRLRSAEVAPIRSINGLEEAYAGYDVYQGDVTGDGKKDHLLMHRTGGGNNLDYRYYFHPILLNEEAVRRFQSLKSPGQSERAHYDAFIKDRWKSENLLHRHYPIHKNITDPVAEAIKLFDNVSPVQINKRLYLNVRVPAANPEYSVLLSYNADMQPNAECVIRLVPDTSQQLPDPINSAPLKDLLTASSKITGYRDRCHGGSSKPFWYLHTAKTTLFNNLLLRPWQIGQTRYHHQLPTPKESTESSKPDYWHYLPYEYFWSLQDPFNRSAYREFEEKTADAIDQLQKYYQDEFGLTPDRARHWAASYLFLVRLYGSANGDLYAGHESLEKIHLGQATVEDFVKLAKQGYDRLYRRLMPDQAGPVPNAVYHRALLFALGAQANRTVIDALMAKGASLSEGDDPALHNAVDQPQMLAHLLRWNEDSSNKTEIRNGFGKTSLMVAAHMNQVTSVNILLEHGADPNAKTWDRLPDLPTRMNRKEPDCRYQGIRYRERTALMYAAENAGLDVISLLVKAGADPAAKDSEGRTILDYLSRNTFLTEAQRQQAKQLLKWGR